MSMDAININETFDFGCETLKNASKTMVLYAMITMWRHGSIELFLVWRVFARAKKKKWENEMQEFDQAVTSYSNSRVPVP